jgi:hypothetical protein
MVFLLIACSDKQIYNAVQHNQRLECSKLPQVRFEECMRQVDGSYEEYARDREDLRNETGN